MEKANKGWLTIRIGVSGWIFRLVPAHPGNLGQRVVKWLCMCDCVCVHNCSICFTTMFTCIERDKSKCAYIISLTHARMHARTHARTHTHTHPFYGPLSRITQVSQYQKGKTNLDFTEARDGEWQWYQLGHMQICTSPRHITTPAPHHSVFYRLDAFPAIQSTATKQCI